MELKLDFIDFSPKWLIVQREWFMAWNKIMGPASDILRSGLRGFWSLSIL